MDTTKNFQSGPRRWTVDGIVFYPRVDQGAWYQVGTLGEVGTLYMPMLADGFTPDVNGLAEIEIAYEDARPVTKSPPTITATNSPTWCAGSETGQPPSPSAERLFARDDVNRVSVTEQPTEQGNGRYR